MQPLKSKVSSINSRQAGSHHKEQGCSFTVQWPMVAPASERLKRNVDEEEWQPNFHWLTSDLAVGGCFPIERADELASTHAIGAVVDLREEDCDDEQKLRAAGIHFLHLPTPDLEGPAVAMLDEGVSFAREHFGKGRKVLIHCQHGIGRSALLALCVLVDRGWEPLDAIAHAKDVRAAVSPSELQFRSWAEWLEGRGLKAPDYHAFGCIAYRHLATD